MDEKFGLSFYLHVGNHSNFHHHSPVHNPKDPKHSKIRTLFLRFRLQQILSDDVFFAEEQFLTKWSSALQLRLRSLMPFLTGVLPCFPLYENFPTPYLLPVGKALGFWEEEANFSGPSL